MGKLSKETKRLILETYNVKTAEDTNTALKDIFSDVLQEALKLNWIQNSAIPKMEAAPKNWAV